MNELRFDKRRVENRRIVRVDTRRRRSGDFWVYDPVLYLDNGMTIEFRIEHTQDGEHSIHIVVKHQEE